MTTLDNIIAYADNYVLLHEDETKLEDNTSLADDTKKHLLDHIRGQKPSLSEMLMFIAITNEMHSSLGKIAEKKQAFSDAIKNEEELIYISDLSEETKLKGLDYLADLQKNTDETLKNTSVGKENV
jgi:hypothetical protein